MNGGSPGEHLVEHAAEGVDVAPAIDVALAGRLLGAHVRRRAEATPVSVRRSSPAAVDGPRDAEVGDDGVALLEQDVLGLDVAMDDAVRVGVAERVGDLAGDAERVVERELPLAIRAGRAAISPSTNGMT